MKRGRVRINPCLVFLNMVFACAGVVLLGIGIWMARHHGTNCVHFLQAFCVGTGLFMLAIALAGLVGSFARVTWLLYLNFGVMFALLLAVLATTVFVLAVTSHGIKAYVSESHNDALSNWLIHQVNHRIESCTRNGQICRFVDYTYSQSSSYYRPALSSIQDKLCSEWIQFANFDFKFGVPLLMEPSHFKVGCCEPPIECNSMNVSSLAMEADCEAWRQVGPQGFCSHCSSCRAAVAENVRHVWHQVAIFKVIILFILIPTYFITCYSFKRDDDHDSHKMSCHECLNCCYSSL